jgi:hypothetical protein
MYVTPDDQIKSVFQEIEMDPETAKFRLSGFSLYGITRFDLEMLYRFKYYEKFNRTLDKKSDNNQIALSSVTKTKTTRLEQMIVAARRAIRQKRYDAQFDVPGVKKKTVDVLFVATSGLKDPKKRSVELYDLIKHSKRKGFTVGFVLPCYDISIRRRSEYDLFYSVDLQSRAKLNGNDEKVVDSYISWIRNKIGFFSVEELGNLKRSINNQLALCEQLKTIINDSGAEYVVSRSLYSDKWVVMACQLSKSRCIEVQHGVFTRDNFYYHALGNSTEKDLLIPDIVMCLGEKWLSILRDQSNFWNKRNSGVVGVQMIHRFPEARRRKRVLVAFQNLNIELLDFRGEIQNLFRRFAHELRDFDFVFRPHPLDLTQITEMETNGVHILLSDPRAETSSDALANCDVLVCATSMMIYEALSIGIPVISLEKFRKMTVPDDIIFVKTTEEILNALKSGQRPRADPFKYNSPTNYSFFDKVVTTA